MKNKEFISLTDLARYRNKKEPKDVIKTRMKSRSTIEYLEEGIEPTPQSEI